MATTRIGKRQFIVDMSDSQMMPFRKNTLKEAAEIVGKLISQGYGSDSITVTDTNGKKYAITQVKLSAK